MPNAEVSEMPNAIHAIDSIKCATENPAASIATIKTPTRKLMPKCKTDAKMGTTAPVTIQKTSFRVGGIKIGCR